MPAVPEVQRLQAADGDRAACGQKRRAEPGGREAALLTLVCRLQEEVIGNSLVLRGEELQHCSTAGGLA